MRIGGLLLALLLGTSPAPSQGQPASADWTISSSYVPPVAPGDAGLLTIRAASHGPASVHGWVNFRFVTPFERSCFNVDPGGPSPCPSDFDVLFCSDIGNSYACYTLPVIPAGQSAECTFEVRQRFLDCNSQSYTIFVHPASQEPNFNDNQLVQTVLGTLFYPVPMLSGAAVLAMVLSMLSAVGLWRRRRRIC